MGNSLFSTSAGCHYIPLAQSSFTNENRALRKGFLGCLCYIAQQTKWQKHEFGGAKTTKILPQTYFFRVFDSKAPILVTPQANGTCQRSCIFSLLQPREDGQLNPAHSQAWTPVPQGHSNPDV